MVRKKKNKKPIAFQEGTVSFEENLPLPYVHYPGFYGAFIGFSKTQTSQMFFCSCMTKAISNFAEIVRIKNEVQHPFTYGTIDFPKPIKEDVLSGKYSIQDIPMVVKYSDQICHQCLREVPEYMHADPMYAGKFKQTYGWYVAAKSFEWGIDSHLNKLIIEDAIPDEAKYIYITCVAPAYKILMTKDPQKREWFDAQAEYHKQRRKFQNLIEDEVRIATGYRKVGEGWISETQLFYLIKKIFPEVQVVRHYRSPLLEHLELDIYLPDLNLGIEYQGEQHFKAIEHWGGEEGLLSLQSRDKKKEMLCKKNKIRLLKINYYDNLSFTNVKQLIDEVMLK